MKEHVQRDIDHLYVLLDHCTHEDVLQQIRKNIRAALNLKNIIKAHQLHQPTNQKIS